VGVNATNALSKSLIAALRGTQKDTSDIQNIPSRRVRIRRGITHFDTSGSHRIAASVLGVPVANLNRHRHSAPACGDGKGELSIPLLLAADARFDHFVPYLPVSPLAEDQAGGVDVGELLAQRVVRDQRAGGQGFDVGFPRGIRWVPAEALGEKQ
jgi:hypothetical protein